MDTSKLSEQIISKMRPEDRRAMGVQTAEEAMETYMARSEKELQTQIAQFLRLRGIWFDCDGMHKRRTGTCGAADFQFPFAGRWISWEVKHGKGKQSPEQNRAQEGVIRQGGIWRTIRSMDEARAHLEELTP